MREMFVWLLSRVLDCDFDQKELSVQNFCSVIQPFVSSVCALLFDGVAYHKRKAFKIAPAANVMDD